MKISDIIKPKSYIVIVTFDLIEAESSHYDSIDKEFKSIKLEKFINQCGSLLDLPNNIYNCATNKTFTSEKEIKSLYKRKIHKIFDKLQVNGNFFVLVAKNWSANVYKHNTK